MLQNPRLPAITFGAHCAADWYSHCQTTSQPLWLTTAHHGALPYAWARPGEAWQHSTASIAAIKRTIRVIGFPPLRSFRYNTVTVQLLPFREKSIGGARHGLHP